MFSLYRYFNLYQRNHHFPEENLHCKTKERKIIYDTSGIEKVHHDNLKLIMLPLSTNWVSNNLEHREKILLI